MLTLMKSIVQPKLDYCSQLWSPADQASINQLEAVQRHLVDRIRDTKLTGLSYWEKLSELRLYSQEGQRDTSRYVSGRLARGWSLAMTSNFLLMAEEEDQSSPTQWLGQLHLL